MADNKMKNDDQQRNMGGANREDQELGQQSPGRGGEKSGQQTGGQQGSQYGQGSQKHQMEEDDDMNTGRGQGGTQNRGGQNR